MALKIPRFDRSIPLVTETRVPTTPFHQWWDAVARGIETSINGIQAALDAAEIAQTAADAAQAAADSVTASSKLNSSGVSGCTITATDAGSDVTITVSAHTRVYGDGTSVAVGGANLTGLAYSSLYYIYYDDAEFDGLGITYQTTTSDATAAQTGIRHLVGAVTTPSAGAPAENGQKTRVPGVGYLEP